MKVLVCGSRDFSDALMLVEKLDELHDLHEFSVVIEGEALGADTMAAAWAEERDISVMPFPANWAKYGRAAGPIRNKQMLDEGKPDLVVAFYSNKAKSKGTANMVAQAIKAGVTVVEYEQEKYDE